MSVHSGNKYHRTIHPLKKGKPIKVDVYSVIEAFAVTNPGLQHAIKKILCAGLRGKGSTEQDLNESIDAIRRVIEIEKRKGDESCD